MERDTARKAKREKKGRQMERKGVFFSSNIYNQVYSFCVNLYDELQEE